MQADMSLPLTHSAVPVAVASGAHRTALQVRWLALLTGSLPLKNNTLGPGQSEVSSGHQGHSISVCVENGYTSKRFTHSSWNLSKTNDHVCSGDK